MTIAGSIDAAKREAVVGKLRALHAGEEAVYTGCRINCGAGHCILKVRLKNGVVTAIEPDDHYNPGVGREDAGLSDRDLIKNRLQLRGCPMAWTWHKLAYSPDRILYPMKRVDGSRRGEGRLERISWDEALDLVATKMRETVEKHGPYSILTPYAPNARMERLFGLWGAGVEGWGWCSMDPERLAIHLMSGVPGWSYAEGGSNDMASILMHTRLVVLWGFEPTITHFGPGHQLAYFIRMARERGVPVICIDPRYTVAAEVMADQWIPIKPGTDTAMMLAVAHVLITEDLYNKEYVERCVDLKGFQEWKAYILGQTDGVAKTPEWAEPITSVPAETIRGFAHLYASRKPTWLWKGWGVARKSRGENTARAAAALQAVMGYWGVAGGSVPFMLGSRPKPPIMMPYGDIPQRMVPKMYRSHQWAQMVLLLDKVRSGEMSVAEYKARIGWRAPSTLRMRVRKVHLGGGSEYTRVDPADGGDGDTILPNPKMLMWGTYYGPGTNTLNNNADGTNLQVQALDRMEFVVWAGTQMAPMVRYADVVLPLAEMTLEIPYIAGGQSYGGFTNTTWLPGVIKPPGEARPDDWVYSELARRLGVGAQYNRYYHGENWDEAWERYLQDEYQRHAEALESQGVKAPGWEEFKRTGLINVDEHFDEPWHGFRWFTEEGKPLNTRSGKIELHSHIIADESHRGRLHTDDSRRLIDDLPNDWRDLPPIPAYQTMYRGMDHPDVGRFPLMLLTSYSRYRNHSTFWNVPWLRGDCYRHAVWMNAADAKARGIRDGTRVRVFNDHGVAILSAYVTSRIMPGIVAIHHGGWYQPDENGVDRGCTPNVFLGDPESPVTAPLVTNLVQIEPDTGEGVQ
jgi:anaerobic dimethyl sulfoxide reductase subunit A